MKHNHLFFAHFADRVLGAFLSQAAVFEAAVGHQVGAPLGAPVNVQVARIDFAGEAHGPLEVARENAGR